MVYLLVSYVFCVIGFRLGVYKERKDWNNLINKGVLPKPKNKNNNA